MSERRRVLAQHVFAQARELREAERESAVVADRAEIAQMVREALALEAQRAQPRCARGRHGAREAFDGLRIRPRIGDRAVARHAPGEPSGVEHRQRLEALFDPLVCVAEPLLEPQHLFADDLEAEMSGLDDACMHRTDGYFVNAVTFDFHEVVFLLAGFPRR